MATARRSSWMLVCLPLVAGWVQLALLAPRLPESVASHFDLAGHVDGWMPRRSFLVVFGLLEAFLAAVFLALVTAVRRGPASLIHLPHREHWLAPEREGETRRALARDVAWLGAATLALMLAIVQHCHRASLGDPPGAGLLYAVLGAYCGCVAWVVLRMCRRHARPESPAGGARAR